MNYKLNISDEFLEEQLVINENKIIFAAYR